MHVLALLSTVHVLTLWLFLPHTLPRLFTSHQSQWCIFDVLRLWDGPTAYQTADSVVVATLCGNLTATAPALFVLGPVVSVLFLTDSAATAEGFYGNYEAVVPTSCSGVEQVVALMGCSRFCSMALLE